MAKNNNSHFSYIYSHIVSSILAIIFACFSTAVMSYISMAMPLGPWIAPTLALMGLLIVRICFIKRFTHIVGLATIGGSVGGILATGFGFSFPTIYFIDKNLLENLMSNPLHFTLLLSGIAFAAGSFGLALALCFEASLLDEQKLSFPIGELVAQIIESGKEAKKAFELLYGFIGACIIGVLQRGIFGFKELIPRVVTIITPQSYGIFSLSRITLDIWPLVWAIGFIAGPMILVPLAFGALSKLILADPLYRTFFVHLSSVEFLFAFCSGMVLFGALKSFLHMPKTIVHSIKGLTKNNTELTYQKIGVLSLLSSLLISTVVLLLCEFSLLHIVYLLSLSALFTYQIAVIAGKAGLAPLGRFATFVMLPAMMLFSLSSIQIVLVATFMEVCGGVCADVLFGRKTARDLSIAASITTWYQWLGLVISSLSIGVIFFILLSNFELGSVELFAYKAQSRQLLISAQQFNFMVLLLGALYGWGLSLIKISPIMVLGGLLMPLNLSIGLILGGLISLMVKDIKRWEPFASGIFAGNSVWMLINIFI